MLNLSGCLKTKTEYQSQLQLTELERQELAQACSDISAQGNIFDLLAKIKESTKSVLELVEAEDPQKHINEITLLADDISVMTKKVQSLGRTEWNEDKYIQSVTWTIDKKDFKDLVSARVGWFGIYDYDVKAIYLMGERRDDLKSKFRFKDVQDGFSLTYLDKISSLNYCQLEKTLMIVVEVRYYNMMLKGSRYFNLMVKR